MADRQHRIVLVFFYLRIGEGYSPFTVLALDERGPAQVWDARILTAARGAARTHLLTWMNLIYVLAACEDLDHNTKVDYYAELFTTGPLRLRGTIEVTSPTQAPGLKVAKHWLKKAQSGPIFPSPG